MIIKFNNLYLEALAQDETKGKPKYNDKVVYKFRKTLKILQHVPDTKSLWTLNGLGFERLKGDKKELFSVRVDYHYRLIFKIEQDVINIREILIINELTNHYQ
ncbi:type II toxin-antitoxin system RelE/ParE family toxin [Pedobacter nyackensis]|uniref:type II toxin-antitoxin system RelE/ParE family toxin n=1 Tax=Pedobacter nyackensis TaxID=475255 RepID=UPI00292E5F01|nr:type II toxin-antitoxin system RelE/ParE family toxin [Pedobacter nyackensis]